MRDLPPGMFARNEVEEVASEAGYKIFHVETERGCHQDMTGILAPFDNGIRSFSRGMSSADRTNKHLDHQDFIVVGSPTGLFSILVHVRPYRWKFFRVDDVVDLSRLVPESGDLCVFLARNIVI